MRLLFHKSIYFPLFWISQIPHSLQHSNHTDNPCCGGVHIVCFHFLILPERPLCVRHVLVGIGEIGDEQQKAKKATFLGYERSITFPATCISQNPYLSKANASAEGLFKKIIFLSQPPLLENLYYVYARKLGKTTLLHYRATGYSKARWILIRINAKSHQTYLKTQLFKYRII